jgi:Tfp pilus assembly protein PilE
MSPTEFAVRMIAADRRFSQALERDDIREMRAALTEKTELLQRYFAASRQRSQDETGDARAAASF